MIKTHTRTIEKNENKKNRDDRGDDNNDDGDDGEEEEVSLFSQKQFFESFGNRSDVDAVFPSSVKHERFY